MNAEPLEPGALVHYSGDQCNDAGTFVVTAVVNPGPHQHFTLEEVPNWKEGRRTWPGVQDRHVGREYFGHCNPRFCTQESVVAFRRAARKALQAQLASAGAS